MSLGLTIALVRGPLCASPALDISCDVPRPFTSKQVGFTKKIICTDASTIDETVASGHGFSGQELHIRRGCGLEVSERNLELGDDLCLKRLPSFPQESCEGD